MGKEGLVSELCAWSLWGDVVFLKEISVIQQKCGCESQHWENTSL